jgi:hypothetical protein
VVLAGGVCVVAAVALMATGRPSTEAVVAQVHGVPVAQVETEATYRAETAAETPAAVVPAAPVVAASPRPQAMARTETALVTSKPTRKQTNEELFPNPVTKNLPPNSVTTSSKPVVPIEALPAATAVSGTKAPIEDTVTIAGCVARDDEEFVLKDTSGADAPTGRSWKSGFLKKRSSSITVVDEGYALRLGSHVGQRVEMRGVLVDRELRARSIRVMGVCE